MDYPLTLRFKIFAIAPQISVEDANGTLLHYVRQKVLKLREEVTVFADRERTVPGFSINADRIIDFSARYRFTDTDGTDLGSVKRQGVKSLWKARYDIYSGESVVMDISEDDPWIKVADAILSQVPFVGVAANYLFHPSYTVTRTDGAPVMRLTKRPAFWEGRFSIEKLADLSEDEETLVLLSLLMMVLLERGRG